MTSAIQQIFSILETVTDPEVPVLSIVDLGIVRDVQLLPSTNHQQKERVCISVTPTYSGCPAMDVIRINIRIALLQHGFNEVEIKTVLSPAWTTAWISLKGRQQLKAYGIAPPNHIQSVCSIEAFQEDEAVQCPHCNSYHTALISRFGSTACKALYKCEDCKEPFDYFKCH